MSAYKKIATQFKNPASLIRALQDCGLTFEQASDLQANTVMLKTHWTRYDGVDTPVAIAIQREELHKKIHSMDGIGFAWAGDHYELVQDKSDYALTDTLNEIKRRYAFHETMNAFHARGWVVGDTATVGNEINITFRQYAGSGY